MRRLVQGGAAPAQHAQPASRDSLAWDDVRVFLACVEGRSFRRAGDILGLNASTVARRIEGFERQLGYSLFGRLTEGLAITGEGEALTASARQMDQSFRDFVRRVEAPKIDHRGVVKISITDGLGTFWMMPLLVEFSRANPNLILQVDCAVDSADVLRFEARCSPGGSLRPGRCPRRSAHWRDLPPPPTILRQALLTRRRSTYASPYCWIPP